MSRLNITQLLVLDLLAARHRLGHNEWPLPAGARHAVTKLTAHGLVSWRYGIIENTILVSLTDTGVREATDPAYVPEIER